VAMATMESNNNMTGRQTVTLVDLGGETTTSQSGKTDNKNLSAGASSPPPTPSKTDPSLFLSFIFTHTQYADRIV
jgi:hypothetical protein